MQLNLDDATHASRLGMNETAERVLALERDLREVQSHEAEAGAEYERTRRSQEAAFESERKKLDRQILRENEQARSERHKQQRRLERIRERRMDRLYRVTGEMEHRLEEELARERRGSDGELKQITERFDEEAAKRRKPLDRRGRRWEELLPQLRERAAGVEKSVREFADFYGVALDEMEPWKGDVDVKADPDRMAEEAGRTFEEVVVETERALGWRGSSFARSGYLFLYHALILVVGVGAAGLAVHLMAAPAYVSVILSTAVILVWLLRIVARRMRGRYGAKARELLESTLETVQRFEGHADGALKNLDALHVALAEEFGEKMSSAESRLGDASGARMAPLLLRLEELSRRKARSERRLLAHHERKLEALEADEDAIRRRQQEAHDARIEAAVAAHRERLDALETGHADRSRELGARRDSAMEVFTRFSQAARDAVDPRNRPWEEVDPRGIVLPTGFPRFVPFGRLEVSLDTLLDSPAGGGESGQLFDLPACLTFPEHGSLLVQHAGGERERALRILQNAVLRVLTSFPAGKARLTIVDPVGLGQSFSALMHLADHDEALVNGRIWTETRHIEQRLTDLTEHIEKVIQMYLRNRYSSIGDYNAEAGELQEPYHFLVIADFPTGFSEVVAERLSSIVSSGPRCGVYTLIAQDTRLEVPPPVDPERLGRNGPILRAGRGGLRIDGDGLDRCAFVPERPPDSGMASTLLDCIGRLSVDADRVEVPFTAVAAGEEEVWTGLTTTGVRVPIGRTGADRLQYFDLGRGTAQHALLAGRTGSGKSTLFHVMITNMSLWLSPDEIEFYLIDFKKGVEFKPFATHGLPHARVVAIESDREFGLSVLKAVDAELARRGDIFRHHGVQDLAAYRRSGAEGILPRTLVMIDEFQEFFTEDDGVARDAALLLDRFVRQGRAFGIHMVLGSQTLSGIYTLAKSTLGQMGVRIALQCNESDSYLILSEDNGVARLLSRPGEAIYNDMSGLIEGNSPFQVVWLPEEEEAVHLERLAARAAATPSLAPRDTVVFEGNLPANIERNPELMALVSGGVAEHGGDDRIWLGEPNAIKGPTEVRFMPGSGSNLLIVGQRRDAAFAMMAAAVLSLSAQHPSEDLRIVILDGGGHEPEFAAHFDSLTSAVPGRVERYDLRSVPDVVAELADQVKAGEEGGAGRPPVYVFAFGLQRLRMLRQEDEFSMRFDADAPESAGEQFSSILREGPPQNVFTVVWCDTAANLTRTLDRRSTREFDMRVLFQMSAADSSELIDSSAANLLGLYNALLSVESLGTFEKFRPYAIPEREVMQRLGRAATGPVATA
ncbi:MAG: FtsK/SpoIIIE domain-containing protein [Planctomycetota bacterium]|jgi:DNA helicase HerA-like ATPase